MSEYADGEGDVTFRVRSFDGLEYSPITVKKYKLNLQAPSIVVNTPAQNSQHDPNSPKGSVVSFSGTASDPYFGVNGNDIKEIWFEITEDSNPQFTSKFALTASPEKHCLRGNMTGIIEHMPQEIILSRFGLQTVIFAKTILVMKHV